MGCGSRDVIAYAEGARPTCSIKRTRNHQTRSTPPTPPSWRGKPAWMRSWPASELGAARQACDRPCPRRGARMNAFFSGEAIPAPIRDAAATVVCHHGPMADSEGETEVREVRVGWQVPTGPAPMVNQFLLQSVPDGDGGPGEIVVRLGYVVVAPDQNPDQTVPVTNVAAFTLTRYRAEQLRGFLTGQIDAWDRIDRETRGKRGAP